MTKMKREEVREKGETSPKMEAKQTRAAAAASWWASTIKPPLFGLL